MQLDPIAIGGWLASAVAAGMAVFERNRAAKSSERAVEAHARAGNAEARQEADKEILKQYDDLIRLTRENAAEWREKATAEHKEFDLYRKQTHDKLNAANSTILQQTEEIANLRGRTDIAPVMDALAKVLAELHRFAPLLERLVQHLEPPKQ